jgi:hypothetical protein
MKHGRFTRRGSLSLACLAITAVALAPSALFGSIEDQRARLPPAPNADACDDPVAGEWLGQQYNPRSVSWQRYRLSIRRAQPGSARLVGEVRVHFWNGPPAQVTPLATCGPGQQSAEVIQPAEGAIDGFALRFGGTSWRLGQVFCNGAGPVGYNPDRFTGTVDPRIQEFQSVNNDGGTAVNEPVVFRRIACTEPATRPQPTVMVTPPAIPEPPRITPRRQRFRCGL